MRLLLLLPLLMLATIASAANLHTADGLALSLDGKGQVAGLKVGESKLPVRVGGGFWVADAALARPPDLLLGGDFETTGPPEQPFPGWQAARYADLPGAQWGADRDSGRPGRVARLDQPAVTAQQQYLPLLLAQRINVRPGVQYRLSAWARWQGLTPAGAPGVYLVFYDAAGKSRQTGLYFGAGSADHEWAHYAQTLTPAPGETTALVYANLYNATGTVWLDDLSLTEVGHPPAPAYRRVLRAPLKLEQGVYLQEQSFPEVGLKLGAAYAVSGSYVSVSGRVEDTTGHDRAVEVTWELPLEAAGWVWSDDLLHRREIREDMAYRTTWECAAGPGYNQIYPFCSLAHGETGLAVGVPWSQGPRVYSLEYDNVARRLQVRFHLGLSRQVQKLPGKAWFSFLLYRHDGQWGLRSAAERYYHFFPGDFAKRVPHEGYLGYTSSETGDGWRGPSGFYGVPALGDFGRGFRWFWHLHTAYSAIRYETEQPAYPEDRTVRSLLAELAIAQGRDLPYGWRQQQYNLLGQPRTVTAEEPAWSLVKRLYEDAAGKITWVGDSRYEGARDGLKAGWLLNFQVTEDPDISSCVKDRLEAAIADWERDNPRRQPYTWAISADGTGFTGRQLDFRPEHIASSEAPLTYDQETRRPAVADVTWEWNHRVLGPLSREHQFLLNRNFICSTPFVGANAPFVDIGLIECDYGSYGMGEDSDLYVRTVGYQKIFRYWFYPARGPRHDDSIREMFHRGLLYAIYPHLVADCERFRDLYLRFVPAIEQLSAAGWQPVPLATTSDPDLRVERYGSVAAGTLAFAFRNVSPRPCRTKVTLQQELGLPTDAAAELVVRDLLSGETLAPLPEAGLVLPVSLGPGEATAYSVLPPGKELQADLRQAAELLRQAAPLDMTEEASYTSNRPAQFIQDGQPRTARPERVLCDGWTAYQGLIWPAGEPVQITLDLNSPHRLEALRVSYGRGAAYAVPECTVEGRDKESQWQKLAGLPAPAAQQNPAVSRADLGGPGEYQFVRLSYPALTKPLWVQEITFSGQDGALLRAADRFDLLAQNPRREDFGLVSQLALALRVRRMLGHDRTLQERCLQTLSAFESVASGVQVRLELGGPLLAGVATPAYLVATNHAAVAFREGSFKLRLPPGWRAAPSKLDLAVPAGQTVRNELALIPVAGTETVSLLGTGVVGEQPLFLNLNQTLTAALPLVAGLDTPFLPAQAGPQALRLRVTSRAQDTLLASLSVQAPDGWTAPAPLEVKVPPRTDTLVESTLTAPAGVTPGRLPLTVRLKHGEVTSDNPLEVIVTRQSGKCSRTAVAPQVDGQATEACWGGASVLGELARGDGRAPTQATTLRLLWDEQRLYLHARCAEDRMAALKADQGGRDGPVWQDDDLALMLNCGGMAYKLEVSASGAFFDAREGDATWNGDWQVAVHRGEGGWEIEASVPWRDLGWLPQSGLCFGINLCRQEKPHGEVSSWLPGALNDGWNVGAVQLANP